jgi:hypothetical protein
MDQNKTSKENIKNKTEKTFAGISKVILKWFFLLMLFLALLFCLFVWHSFVWKAGWSEEKKREYVSEQANFKFNKAGYEKTVNMIANRKNKFDNFPKFTGRDIFFPEGF